MKKLQIKQSFIMLNNFTPTANKNFKKIVAENNCVKNSFNPCSIFSINLARSCCNQIINSALLPLKRSSIVSPRTVIINLNCIIRFFLLIYQIDYNGRKKKLCSFTWKFDFEQQGLQFLWSFVVSSREKLQLFSFLIVQVKQRTVWVQLEEYVICILL